MCEEDRLASDRRSSSPSTASSVEIYTVMGLFNSGKNEKVEKVSKYERHYNVPHNSSRRRSSKHRSHQNEPPAPRAMSQPPMMRLAGGAGGFYPPAAVFSPPVMGGVGPNVMRYPVPPYDLSKYAPAGAFPFGGGQIPPMNFPPVWNNGMALVNQRSPFPPSFGDYQQGGWPVGSPSNYGYMPAMQF